MRFGAHAPLNADHAGIDAIEPLPKAVAVIVYAHFYPRRLQC
jgi:hypothetical protein